MAKKKQSRTARIRERIAETTAVAKEKFIPIEDGPDPRMHRHEIPSLISVKEAAGGSFEESFDYEDPTSERFLPEGMDGVIQIKTRGEVAADDAYAMVLKDPASVLAPRQFYSEGGPKHRTIVDAGHELAKKQISEHHDPARVDRVREGLGISAEGEEPALPEVLLKEVPPEIEEAIAREMQSPHKASVGCAACGGVTYTSGTIIDRDGKVFCQKSECRAKANLSDD